MSLRRGRDCGCNREEIFEFADGGLDAARKREVRDHLEACPDCSDMYRYETGLSNSLCSLKFGGVKPGSATRNVVMALPTRRMRARFMWAVLAAGLLAVSLLALEVYQSAPIAPVMDAMSMLWGSVSGAADLAHAAFDTVGPIILIALGVGAFLDLLMAAAVLTAARRSRRV